MARVLTIAGTPVNIQKGWVRSAPANGNGTLQFDVVSKDGSYVPALDAAVSFVDGAVTLFGGLVQNVRVRGAENDGHQPIRSEVTAIDYNVLASRRYFGAVSYFPAGTLKANLTLLLPFLPGVTLDAAQVTGPSLPDLWDGLWKISDILDQFTVLTGYVWEINYSKVLSMYAPGSRAAPFNIAAGDGHVVGDVTSEPTRTAYANRVLVYGTPVTSEANDAGEQTAHGIWELVVQAPDTTTQAAADALAAAILAASLPIVNTVTYPTYTAGLKPGQTQTINFPKRSVNNTFLITDVTARDANPAKARYDVTAIEGLVYRTGWQETIKSWGSSAGGGLTTLGGAGSSTSFTRYAYYLGGNGVDAVSSPTPTWVPASGGSTTLGQGAIQVQVNTIPRGTLAAQVTVRLRALDSGVSVQARIYDCTAAAACPGTSAVVTSTTWQTATFVATLTSGSHLYELQVLAGVSNAPVLATGYLE